MRSLIRVVLCGIVFSISAGAIAETPAEIFREMDSRKRASLEKVYNFSQMKTTMGVCTLEHFKRELTESTDGRGKIAYMRLVPISEVMAKNNPDNPISTATPDQLDLAAGDLRLQGPALDQAMRNELNTVGLPGNLGFLLTHPPKDKPWLSPLPGDMLGNYATMLEGAAKGKKQDAKLKALAEQEAKKDPLAAAAERTRIVGHETFNSRPAIHLVVEDLNLKQSKKKTQSKKKKESKKKEFILNTLHLWVDAEKYVPLKMQMDGIAIDGSETRKMRIEREDMSYQTVPGCESMYVPHRSVMRISGILNAQEQAQMVEAQAKLAEFEAQKAKIPPAQYDMIMQQMGPQLEMFKNMASGQGIEVISLTTGMRCNAGRPSNKEYMQTAPGVSQGACIGFVK